MCVFGGNKKKKKSRKADQTEVSESTGGAATRDERLRNATHAEKKKSRGSIKLQYFPIFDFTSDLLADKQR